jgi:hypothetical protein
VAADPTLLVEWVVVAARVALEVLLESALAAIPVSGSWYRWHALAHRGRLVVVRHCVLGFGMGWLLRLD